MRTSASIIIAREDLSVPGAMPGEVVSSQSDQVQARFFDLVSSRPDVIVLDLRRAPAAGVDAIRAVTQRTRIPILALCPPEQPLFEEYRHAGAADCLPAPVDVAALHQAVQRLLQLEGGRRIPPITLPGIFAFAGMRFDPRQDLLSGENTPAVSLSKSESRLLAHLLSNPRKRCSRGEVGRLLHGSGQNVGDRALDTVIGRLRKKLAQAGGADAEQLIESEFGRDYSLLTDVAVLPQNAPTVPPPAAIPAAGRHPAR